MKFTYVFLKKKVKIILAFDGCKYWTCDNGGTCYVNGTDNVPKCSCLKGWNGKHCENGNKISFKNF